MYVCMYVGGIWARGGAQGRKEKNACKETIVFSIFLRSDSEREKSDWSELIECQSSTQFLFPIGRKQHHVIWVTKNMLLVKRDEICLREFIVRRHKIFQLERIKEKKNNLNRFMLDFM